MKIRELLERGRKAAPAVPQNVQALAQANNIANPNQIRPGQQIKLPDGSTYTVAKGDTLGNIASGKYKGTAPVAQAAQAAPAAQDAGQQGGPTTVTNPAQATQVDQTADDGTGGGMDLAKMAAQGTAMRQQGVGAVNAPNALGVQSQAGGAFGQPGPEKDKPNTQQGTASTPEPAPAPAPAPATQPDNGLAKNPEIVSPEVPAAQASSQAVAPTPAAPAPAGTGLTYAQVNPDTGASTEKGTLQSRGGATNVKLSSDDEMLWRSKQGPLVNLSDYPGPGKWDPKTGRTKRESIEYHQKDNALLQRMLQIAGLK